MDYLKSIIPEGEVTEETSYKDYKEVLKDN